MLILSLNLKKYILKIYKKNNLIINKSSCLLGKKLFHREREGERERENHIKLSTLMNIYNMYILPTQIHVYVTTWKKKKTWGVRGILWKDHW